MATIIPFPNSMSVPECGLTKQECNVLDIETEGLMQEGQAMGISIHNGGQFMCIYDCHGEPYFIGREEGICYLFDHEETLLAESRHFEIVMQALESLLIATPKAHA